MKKILALFLSLLSLSAIAQQTTRDSTRVSLGVHTELLMGKASGLTYGKDASAHQSTLSIELQAAKGFVVGASLSYNDLIYVNLPLQVYFGYKSANNRMPYFTVSGGIAIADNGSYDDTEWQTTHNKTGYTAGITLGLQRQLGKGVRAHMFAAYRYYVLAVEWDQGAWVGSEYLYHTDYKLNRFSLGFGIDFGLQSRKKH